MPAARRGRSVSFLSAAASLLLATPAMAQVPAGKTAPDLMSAATLAAPAPAPAAAPRARGVRVDSVSHPLVYAASTRAVAIGTALTDWLEHPLSGRSGRVRIHGVARADLHVPILAELFGPKTRYLSAAVGGTVAPVAASAGDPPLLAMATPAAPPSSSIDRILTSTSGASDTPAGLGVEVVDHATGASVRVVRLKDFDEKTGGTLNGYRLGMWPAEKRAVRSAKYENPTGFIEVTPDMVDLPVSDHFRLGDFITHDQANVWPKYVALSEDLLDKLELVLEDLNEHGVPTRYVRVLSGFRTPAYNELGVGDPMKGGRARDSRHQFGDAADIIIDSDRDGRMDDLNGDGRVDARDVRVIEQSVERVEAEYDDLVGGLGQYPGTGPSGPFAHIDVRGTRARWTVGAYSSRTKRHARRPSKAHGKSAHASAKSTRKSASATKAHGHTRR